MRPSPLPPPHRPPPPPPPPPPTLPHTHTHTHALLHPRPPRAEPSGQLQPSGAAQGKGGGMGKHWGRGRGAQRARGGEERRRRRRRRGGAAAWAALGGQWRCSQACQHASVSPISLSFLPLPPPPPFFSPVWVGPPRPRQGSSLDRYAEPQTPGRWGPAFKVAVAKFN